MQSRDTIILSDGSVVNIPAASSDDDDALPRRPRIFEEVRNVWGSSAGAGSDFFDSYRRDRASELIRIRKMTKEHEATIAHAEFQAKRQRGLEEAKERTAKRARKRNMRKKRRRCSDKEGYTSDKDNDRTHDNDRSDSKDSDNDRTDDDNNKNDNKNDKVNKRIISSTVYIEEEPLI